MIKPRGWQLEALDAYNLWTEKHFLLDATPGAGKTLFSAFVAKHLFERGQIDFALIVVPTTAIKGDKDAGFLGDWNKVGVQITRVLKDGRDRPKEYRGAVVTYSQLPNLVGTIEVWARNGLRLLLIPDEIHHASEDNSWGSAIERCGNAAVRILSMTGTAFRGDERKISFIKYGADDKAIAQRRYLYRDAVRDHVCRKVDFPTDDSITQFMLDQENHTVRISEAKNPDDLRGATNTVFRTDKEFLPGVLEKAEDCLTQYRSWDRDAGGIIICRSGKDENDNRHLLHVAKLVAQTLGEAPEIIAYDDPDANAKIERFRISEQRWICAVRKIAEGVDIKRLRTMVMATRPSTELLFRQLVGRVVRVDDEKRPGDATVFIAKFPQLVEWAQKIAEEAEAGLKEKNERDSRQAGQKRNFASLAASHENSGAISDFGDQYNADEVNAAEKLRSGDPELAEVSITTLAYIQRKLGIVPEPMTAAEPPLQIRKTKLRQSIVAKTRRLAIIRDPGTPDFKRVWHEIGAIFNVFNADDLVENRSIEIMRQIEAWAAATIAREAHGK
jgi:superfamily II DNA or RNA helicase